MLTDKIYTLTFHNSKSHGALLQCYALNKFLINNGFDAQVIDYLPDYFKQYNQLLPIKNHESSNVFKGFIKSILLVKYRYILKNKFDFFKKEIKITEKRYNSINELQDDFNDNSYYICGSDQIWNPRITGNDIDDVFFLRFTNSPNKFSYAASTGNDLSNEIVLRDKINYYLSDFKKIMLREENVFNLLTDSNKKKSCMVSDPVFLLSKEDWVSMIKEDRIYKKPYILLYNLSYNEELYNAAISLAKKRDLNIIEIERCEIKHFHKDDITKRIIASPSELLNLIYYSEYIFTNSFHGTCFSIIFNKNFSVFIDENRGERIKNLLNIFSLDVCNLKFNHLENQIDYSSINKIIEEYTAFSRKELLNCLEQA